jgi:hypothetical protein
VAANRNGFVAPGFVKEIITDGGIMRNGANAPNSLVHFRCASNGTGVGSYAPGSAVTIVHVTHDYGRSWTTVPATSQEQNALAHDNRGTWMINSSSSGSGSTTLWSYNDGVSFTQLSGPFSGFQYAAGYNNGRFFVGQYSATQLYWTDDKGLTWVLATLPNSQHMRTFCGDGLSTVIVTGELTATLHYSKDNGKTWHAGATGCGFSSYQTLYARGKFWWPCGANQYIEYTEDCINLKRVNLPTTSGTWTSLGWSPCGYFILTGTADTRILVSRDGMEWTVLPYPISNAVNWFWSGTPSGFTGVHHGGGATRILDLS